MKTTDTPRMTTSDDTFRYKAISEVKEIRAALGDDGRRTHKEILELATKASKWREWKEKYIDLRNAHIAEGQDPAGTIWEHADKLHRELSASKAEVERLTKDITVTEFARARDWINWRYKELDEAKAEVDRLTKKLSITEDELSDAREWLDERYKATSEADERAEKAEAEVESLKTSIKHWEDQCLHFQHAWERSQAMYNKLIYTSTKPIESQEDDK